MARGVNKVIIVGTLGNDPDVKYMASGAPVVNVSVATNESWKDKQSGEQQERTEWHRIVMFGKLAEIAAQYLKKGSQAYFEGKIKTDKYQKDGVDTYSTSIVADQMQMLGGKGSDSQAGSGSSRAPHTSQASPQGQPQAAPVDDGIDQDIPF